MAGGRGVSGQSLAVPPHWLSAGVAGGPAAGGRCSGEARGTGAAPVRGDVRNPVVGTAPHAVQKPSVATECK